MQQKQVDVKCKTETNVEWNNKKFKHEYTQTTRRYDRHAQIAVSTSIVKFKKLYKPGGTNTTSYGRYS
jgi:hypothetical protein